MKNLITPSSKRRFGKGGFTLMELLIYMALVGIIVVIAGRAFSDSTKMRVRTQGKLKASQDAENAAILLKTDIAQTGAKSAISAAGATSTSDAFLSAPEVYMDASNTDVALRDSSSYSLSTSNTGDDFKFRRVAYTDAGAYVRVEEVNWFVQDGKLYRSCKTIAGTADEAVCPSGESGESGESDVVPVEIIDGVTSFDVRPSKPNIDHGEQLLFPVYEDNLANKAFRLIPYFNESTKNYRALVDPPTGDVNVRLTSFMTNYSSTGTTDSDPIKHMLFLGNAGSTSGAWNTTCKAFTFKKDSTYEISFRMSSGSYASKMFQPGIDHMSLGLRVTSELDPTRISDVPDFYFYPPENERGGAARTMRFSTHLEDVEACVALNLVFYSPTVAAGSMIVKDFTVKSVGEHYSFGDGAEKYTPTLADKKNVKAFKVKLSVKELGEFGNVEFVVPVPSNGARI